MAPNRKIKKACDAMKILGIPETKVKLVLKNLLKNYDNKWDFIEEEHYKVLIDAIFEEADEQATEKEDKKKAKDAAKTRGKKKNPEKIQPSVKDEEKEEEEMDEDNIPLKRKLRQIRNRGYDNNRSLTIGSLISQKPNKEASKTQSDEEDEDDVPPLKRYKRRSGERRRVMTLCNNASPSLSSSVSMESEEAPPLLLLPAAPIQDEKDSNDSAVIILDDEPNTDHKLDAGDCSAPMFEMDVEERDRETEDIIKDTTAMDVPPLAVGKSSENKLADVSLEDIIKDTTAMDVPPLAVGKSSENKLADVSLELASSTSGEAKISLSFQPATEEMAKMCLPTMDEFRRAMEEKCLKSYKIVHPDFSVLGFIKDMCSCYEELAKKSINQSTETETVSDMSKVGHEGGAAGSSMGMVVVPECDISEDGWKALSNVKDITVGEEVVEIPWVNEINDEVPSHFRYISQSFVFQNAPVKFFSLSSFSDEQSCPSSCIEDCLASEMLCNCANAVDNGFAYTATGLIKVEFLEARMSEARDQRKQVWQYCKECPLEKAKNQDILEPCKGHLKRKAIKECWIQCGCTKRCGNRVVQRGIHNKLQVFFTPNGKGWGLRTLEKLPKGAFVCEYIGEILTISELYQRRLEDKLTCPVILDAHWGSEEWSEDDKALCLDGTRYGNIARFLNHRCLDANLIEIPVQVETPDQNYYHLAFFTTRNIEAMEELTWDYGIDFNDEDSLMKPFECMCGSGRYCRNMKRTKKRPSRE